MNQPQPSHYRYRIRFAKKGLMRFVGHQELMRVFERAMRRCGLRIRPREGFRTKVRLSFPLSLALGFEADEEVFQVDLQERVDPEELKERLQAELPDGLQLGSVRAVAPHVRARVLETHYRVPVPEQAERLVNERMAQWQTGQEIHVSSCRKGVTRTITLRPGLCRLERCAQHVEFALRHDTKQTGVRPIDVLHWLGLEPWLREGLVVTRTKVLLEDETQNSTKPGTGR